MNRMAIDIVLLPQDQIMGLAIEQNHRLAAKYGTQIVLERTGCLPHVSLLMGCIEAAGLDPLVQVIQAAARLHRPGTLTAIGLAVMTNRLGQKISSWLIDKTDPLQALHEYLLDKTAGLLDNDPDPSMFCGGQAVSETTLEWVRSFRVKSSGCRFWPHITLGYGVAGPLDRPIPFNARSLALCHLGDHCTCRRVLFEVVLDDT